MNTKSTQDANKKSLYIVVGILVAISIIFKLLNGYKLEQKSILFIGIPALLTMLIIKYVPKPKNLYALVFKVITLFLMMSGILFGEGIACIIMAAPIFYGVGAILVLIYNFFNKKNKPKIYSFVAIPLIILLAQPLGIFKDPKVQTVKSIQIVSNKVTWENFEQQPDFLKNYPHFFKLGFPKPIHIEGKGHQIGDYRTIQFKSNTKGIGELTLEIIEKTDSKIIFQPKKDETHMHHWLHWDKIIVEKVQTEDHQTAIQWTSQYKCVLGPAWYFEPFERMAVKIMNKHLIHAYFN